tara:strand:+ start:139 stop:435 length:297 start_codon:yes stop_codon:yes gene_type:complete
MSLNREQKRLLQRQGEVDAEGEPIRERRQPQQKTQEERAGVIQFSRDVRSELRKVAWPSRSETSNYTVVVIITMVVITAVVAGLDYLFSNSVLELFDV